MVVKSGNTGIRQQPDQTLKSQNSNIQPSQINIKQMKNVVLLTAKGGNQTLENKNIIPINGKPSMAWSIQAAKESQKIDEIFVTTERSEEHTSELQSRGHLVCRLLLEKKKTTNIESINKSGDTLH